MVDTIPSEPQGDSPQVNIGTTHGGIAKTDQIVADYAANLSKADEDILRGSIHRANPACGILQSS